MTYRFGPFRYDAEQRVLFRDGQLVPLVPKALETLHVLVERRGRLVEKSELMKLVWPDTRVEDIGIARNISILRKALGDESDEDGFIETVPRRGYRFAAEVVTEGQADTADPATQPPVAQARPAGSPRRWWWVAACLGALALAVFIYYEFYVPSLYLQRGDKFAGLAVIPFECLCPDLDAEELSEGFNEVLVADLAQVSGIEVLSPSTVRRHQRFGISTGLMGRLLGLELLVEGSIQQLGDRLRVTARLIDVHTGRVAWADTYDEPAGDLGAAQALVGQAVAAEIEKSVGTVLSH